MAHHLYTVLFEYFNDEGLEGYSATVPALPGCITWGVTLEEAKVAVAEAIQGYLEVLIEEGQPLPEDTERTDWVRIEKIPVSV